LPKLTRDVDLGRILGWKINQMCRSLWGSCINQKCRGWEEKIALEEIFLMALRKGVRHIRIAADDGKFVTIARVGIT